MSDPSPSSTGTPIRWGKAAIVLGAALIVQSAYLAMNATPDLVYVANVFAHWFGGLALAPLFVWVGRQAIRRVRAASPGAAALGMIAIVAFVLAVIAAVVLVILHNVRPHRWILIVHIVLSCIAVVAALGAFAAAGRRSPAFRWIGAAAMIAVAIVVASHMLQRTSPDERHTIANPDRPPATMDMEAMGGAEGPFFPSSVATSTGGRIPSNFFMTSETCARCHKDIYEAWKGSAHHFSSFNNQWYRKSIEYMQSVNSVQSSKWCAGCHDHAVILNGMMDRPITEFIHTQEAHTGLACNSCHAITQVKSTMGQGDFHLDYPPLHDLAVSENPALRWLHDFAVQLDPGPHKETFLKPYHKEQSAEFCASCHKVHLDVPVNNYRWIRGFNEYDNWQASGISGEGARSFYYPAQPMDCADCHMPRVKSNDKGNVDGYVHDHSFLAANTALPMANLHEDQLRRTIDFLQKSQVSVDLFAAGPARAIESSGEADGSMTDDETTLSSTFGVGEEQAMAVGGAQGPSRELAPIWAPLDRADVAVRRGEEIHVDVVVRTRTVGHFFPGGTVDAHEVWLELRGKDENGKMVYWSGVVHDGGSGEVDPGAHFYKNHMVDGHGNEITKRNAWAARAVAWVSLIPPGAADVAHFRMRIPEDCGDTITLEARLNYRKFTHANTMFSFAGEPAPGEPAGPGEGIDRVTKHYDDRVFVTGEVPENVSAEVREIPDLPHVVMSRAEAKLRVVDAGTKVENVSPAPKPDEWSRWNDYGIGLFRQDDLQGARRAWNTAIVADEATPESYVNLGRVALREGLLEDAGVHLAKALERNENLAKTHYFLGVMNKGLGKYDEALVHLRRAEAQYPKDRVVLNDIGRVLFLQRKFEEATRVLQRVIAIDPEDLMAHYNLMLSYKGMGRLEDAAAEQALYERFKADEDANIILGPYLRKNPHANRMRQLIHEQVSVPREVIDREVAIREKNGEPNVVLPGEGAAYAKRIVERGRALIAAGKGAKRHLGPVEAGFVDPIDLDLANQKPATGASSAAGVGAAAAPSAGGTK